MALLSNQGRSSPTRRGKWILDKILCSPPPSPPANVDNNLPQPGPGQTTRDVLEQRPGIGCARDGHPIDDPRRVVTGHKQILQPPPAPERALIAGVARQLEVVARVAAGDRERVVDEATPVEDVFGANRLAPQAEVGGAAGEVLLDQA